MKFIAKFLSVLAMMPIGIFIFTSPVSAADTVTVTYAPAKKAGTGTCPTLYRAIKAKYSKPRGLKMKRRRLSPALGASFQHGLTGQCYSCPASYKRSLNPNIKAKDACVRNIKGRTYNSKATYRGKVNAAKPKGAFFDPRKGGEYWSCPKGTHRTIFPVTGSKACERRAREAFKRAQKGKKTLAAWDCKGKWFWDGYKGGRCWSCNGWRRTAHHVNSSKACVRKISAKMYRAKRHGSVKNPKPRGAFFDPRKGGEYWSCPSGYKRSVVPVTSGKACVKVIAPTVRKAKATYRGKMGCAKGAFKNGLYPECYRCPKGYGRSLAIGKDLTKVRKACVKVVVKLPKPNAKFLAWAKKEAKKINQKYLPVMKQIAAMAPRIASKKNIDAYMNAKSEAERKRIRYHMIKPFLAWVKKRSRRKASLDFNWAQHDYPGSLDDGTVGVKVASADAAQAIQLAAGGDKVRKNPSRIDALPTVSLGMAIDVSIGFGGTFGALEAWDTTASGNGRNRGITYTSAAWTVGASAGGDVAPEIGIWTPLNHGLGGDAHGFVIAAAFKGGLGVTYWWDYKGKFLGFAMVPQVGLSAEAEYIRGNTKIGDKKDLYSKDEN